MLSFREVLFSKNFSYNFCYRLDDFKRPLVIQGFSRVFFNRDSFERECKIVYTWENFQEIFIGIVGLNIEYRFPQFTSDKISLNSWIESAFIILFFIVTFLLLESSPCFIEIVKIGKWSEISVFKVPVFENSVFKISVFKITQLVLSEPPSCILIKDY